MQKDTTKIECQTPTPGKKPTRILKWKYDIIARAILDSVPENGDGIIFRELPTLVSQKLDRQTRSNIGSIPWYTTTVKLDLECRNKIYRVSSAKPQRLLKNKP